jgi:hypothetical protein
MAKKIENVYVGGLSDKVVNSYRFKKYTEGPFGVHGYLGSSLRTKRRDEIVEKELQNVGLGAEGIAFWLTSVDARNMMNEVTFKTSQRDFRVHVKEYVKDAFIKVTIWGHPDHQGTIGSTNKLFKKIQDAFVKV